MEKTPTELIREKILASGLSMYRICKETKLTLPAMQKFMKGGGLHCSSLDKLCSFFHLELRPKRRVLTEEKTITDERGSSSVM